MKQTYIRVLRLSFKTILWSPGALVCLRTLMHFGKEKEFLKASHLSSSFFIHRARKVVFLAWVRDRILYKYKAIKSHAAGTWSGPPFISWHELATNPITQNPRRSPLPSQQAQREWEHIAWIPAQLSLKSSIFYKTLGERQAGAEEKRKWCGTRRLVAWGRWSEVRRRWSL